MKGRLLIVGAVLLALGSAGLSYWGLFLRRETLPSPAPHFDQPAAAITFTVGDLAGAVEVAGPGGATDGGAFRPARAGEPLTPAMRIRTGDSGAATLRASDGSTVKLLGATNARVESLTRELARLSLGAGMVEADVRDDPNRLVQLDLDDPSAVQRGDGAAARTRGASFVASTDGAGHGAVATRGGEVILSARGKEVTIHTGQYARLSPGQPPGAPSAIPPSLFLKVAWPAAASRQRTIAVTGEAAPGSRVAVEGRFVRVDPDGKYRADLTLPDGTHQLTVDAVDLAGRPQHERSPPIVIDSTTDFHARPPQWGR